MPVTRIEVGALNIVASPHLSGVYRQVLSAVADKEIELWGSDRAKITSFREIEDRPHLLYGRVLVWAEIDKDGAWLNKPKNIEATPAEKAQIADALPEDFEPNFRSFYFIFNEKNHHLVLEYRNELGQHFGPKRAERMFSRLFERHLPSDAPEIDVTVIPEDETLDKIFAIPRLRRLEIFVKRPNPDDVGDDAARILDRLEAQGARSQKLELVKAAKQKSLKPDENTRALAILAVANGHVTGEGKDEAGNPLYESTEEHPKIRPIDVEGPSSFGAFLSSLHFF